MGGQGEEKQKKMRGKGTDQMGKEETRGVERKGKQPRVKFYQSVSETTYIFKERKTVKEKGHEK